MLPGEYDPFTEEVLPPPESIDTPPHDPEPGIRRESRVIEGELELVDRQPPDAPRHRGDQPSPRADRAEDLLRPRSPTPATSKRFPGVLEWYDDGAWDDTYGLDVAESF